MLHACIDFQVVHTVERGPSYTYDPPPNFSAYGFAGADVSNGDAILNRQYQHELNNPFIRLLIGVVCVE